MPGAHVVQQELQHEAARQLRNAQLCAQGHVQGLLHEGALLGPPQRIKERYREWEGSGVTGLTLTSFQPEALELMATLANTR